jgi:molybdopterin-binding protein
MRISARNQIKGTVIEVKKGATTSHIRVDIGNGRRSPMRRSMTSASRLKIK